MSETKIMIVAGEASGDLHGAHLVSSLKQIIPGVSICGMGGENLRQQGVEILYNAAKLAVVGFLEVFSHLQDIRAAMKELESRMKKCRPDLLILIDFPDFNLILAGKAKKLGVPVFYYISPQVWAWRSGRVKKIARLVNRMAVILPFEKAFYRDRGMDVDFVGHPLLDSVGTILGKEEFCLKYDIPGQRKIIGLLPGSRRKEISSILPLFLSAVKQLQKNYEDAVFLLPLASTLTREDLEASGLHEAGADIRVINGDRYDLMSCCDAVMAASGTVTLELAILGVPMVVAYRVSPMTYFLGRKFIKVKYASLVNLVAEREIVPEYLQYNATAENIAAGIREIIDVPSSRTEMLQGLSEVRERLGEPGGSKRTAELVVRTIGEFSDAVGAAA